MVPLRIAGKYIDRLKANTLGRDFVVGDIHGCYDLLMEGLDAIQFDRAKDRLFSVGDLTDRGPDSLKCAELIYEPWFFATQGNHDRMFFNAIIGTPSAYHSPRNFYHNGGDWVREYVTDQLRALAYDMLEKMPLVIFVGSSRKGFAVTHSRLNSGEADPDYFVWDRSMYDTIQNRDADVMHNWKKEVQQEYFLDAYNPNDRLVYVGHNTLPNGHRIFVDNHFMIDSGAYRKVVGHQPDSCLTIVEHKTFLKKIKALSSEPGGEVSTLAVGGLTPSRGAK